MPGMAELLIFALCVAFTIAVPIILFAWTKGLRLWMQACIATLALLATATAVHFFLCCLIGCSHGD